MTTKLPDFAQHCEAACVKLWGEPQLRTPKQLRWSGDDAYGARTYDTHKRVWYDRGAQRGGSTLELIAYSKGLPNEKLRGRAIFEMWQGLYELDVGCDPPPPPESKSNGSGGKSPPFRDTFPYHDEHNALLFEVVRFDTTNPDERFRQRRPDGKDGWIWNLKGVRRVLYRLSQVIEAVKAGERVLVTEGEKDANTAVKLGYVATTMPGGVKKWRAEYDEFLRAADVVVIADNDAPGQEHAAKLAKRLVKVAGRVRTVSFEVKDLTEWVEAGGTREQLDAMIEQAPNHAAQAGHESQEDPQQEAEAIEADAEIARLAKLSAVEYEQQRNGAAKALKVRASILDRLVRDERERLGLDADDGKQGHAIAFPEPEPWPESVSGAKLLDGIAKAIRAHVVMPDPCRDASALWVVHTYLTDCFLISPRLGVRSPTKGCGKTLFLDVLGRLVLRPLPTANVTPAATFRVIEGHRPTLLIDEGDTYLRDNDELRGVLNSGYRKGGAVLRTVGDDHEPRSFATYSACAIALIGALPDTLHDRAVTVDLKRRLPSEKVEPFRPDRAAHLEILARKAARWAKDSANRIGAADPAMPGGIINREADNWRPLLAIADEAGGEWPERARKAAAAAHIVAADDAESRLELLLGDIRDVFDKLVSDKDRISSAHLIEGLVEIVPRPWAEYGRSGKAITQNKLARLLKPLGIAPQKVRIGTETPNGYHRHQFQEAWDRFLSQEGGFQPEHWNKCDEMGTSDLFQSGTAERDVPDAKCEKSNSDGLCSSVPDEKPPQPDEPGLSRQRIRDLAEQYQERAYANARENGGDTRIGECDAWLRQRLADDGAPPEFVEVEFKRVMAEVFRA